MHGDENYFLMRAEQHEAKAAESENDAAKACHLRIARYYRQSAIDHCLRSLDECQLNASQLPIS